MPLNTTKDLTRKKKISKMDGGTNMGKKQKCRKSQKEEKGPKE